MRTKDGGYAFSLYAGNHEIIGRSQVYRSMDSVRNGIESVRKNAESPIEDQTLEGYGKIPNPKWEIFMDEARGYRFRLKAANGEIVLAASQGYTRKRSALKGIESVRRNKGSEVVRKEQERALPGGFRVSERWVVIYVHRADEGHMHIELYVIDGGSGGYLEYHHSGCFPALFKMLLSIIS